jgi:hypothetical protein
MAQGAALKAKDHFPGLMKIYKYMSETVIRIIPLDWKKNRTQKPNGKDKISHKQDEKRYVRGRIHIKFSRLELNNEIPVS